MNKRIHWIDTLRGITIISMVAYHFTWDLVYLFGVRVSWMNTSISYIWQQSICWTFILLSGFCWSFGRHPFRRGVLVFGIGLLIMGITCAFLPQERIVFGILTFLGTAMLLLIPLDRVLKLIPPLPAAILFFCCFLLTKKLARGFLGFDFCKWLLPKSLYCNYFSTFLGFPYAGFFSTDYFALFPWLFLFLTGYELYHFMVRGQLLSIIPDVREPFFSFLGKRSLLIYVLHQPVLYGLYLFWQALS